jgi:hypothetical protein
MLREPQHAGFSYTFQSPSVRPELVEGLRGSFSAPWLVLCERLTKVRLIDKNVAGFRNVLKKGESNMKDTYETPKLTVHGTVNEMTQAFGASSAADTIIYGQFTFPGNGGSQDGIVVPRP